MTEVILYHNTKLESPKDKNDLIKQMIEPIYYKELVLRRQIAEKEKRNKFHDFNDRDMIYYYVHEQKNANEKKNRQPNTIKEYLRELLTFSQHLVVYGEDIGVDIDGIKEGSLFKSLEPRHIERYHDWLRNNYPILIGRNSYSPATYTRKITIVKSFLRFLENEAYVDVHLSRSFKSETVTTDERPNKDLGPHEVLQLLDFFNNTEPHPVIFGILHVLVTTGLRNSELCEAKMCDLSYDSVREDYYLKVRGKGNKKRLVPIKQKVFESIQSFREIRGMDTKLNSKDESYIFTTSSGKNYTNSYLSNYLKKAILRTNIEFLSHKENPITPHTFRHAFAIISYSQGADIYAIMRSLGHQKIETTMIYLQTEFEKEKHTTHLWNQGEFKEYI